MKGLALGICSKSGLASATLCDKNLGRSPDLLVDQDCNETLEFWLTTWEEHVSSSAPYNTALPASSANRVLPGKSIGARRRSDGQIVALQSLDAQFR